MARRMWQRLAVAVGLCAILSAGRAIAQDKPATEALPIKIPVAKITGTPPKDLQLLKTLEPWSDKVREPFPAPVGARNLALKRPVTSSDPWPVAGNLERITDGEKEGTQDCLLELAPGKQWVQIDLGQPVTLYVVVVWHRHDEVRVYKAVVVQVSDDATFAKGVKTVCNNDIDNSVGQGVGKDLLYFENNQGRLVDAKGVKGRYVRLYSNGNTSDDYNHYVEVEVWGLPAK
jgi:hypothetical protein